MAFGGIGSFGRRPNPLGEDVPFTMPSKAKSCQMVISKVHLTLWGRLGKQNSAGTMAKLIVKSKGFGDQVIQLNLGVNRLGRGPHSDFLLDHPTVSGTHCEIALRENGLLVRDCGSTNGTFIDGELIQEATVSAGQTLHLGDVELFVESTEVNIAIPKFETPIPAPPVMLTDGSLVCPRHKHARATHQCTYCQEILCDGCVRRLRRRGGKVLKLCPLCSHPCERIGGEKKPKKKTFLGLLQKTMKLPFLRDRFAKRASEEP